MAQERKSSLQKVVPRASEIGCWPPATDLASLFVEETMNVQTLRSIASRGSGEHSLPQLNIAQQLGSDPLKGLPGGDGAHLHARVETYGGNYLPEQALDSYCALVLDALKDNVVIALIIMATISLVVEMVFGGPTADDVAKAAAEGYAVVDHRATGWIESFAIYCSVLIIINVSAMTNWKKQRMFKELSKELDQSNKKFVVRGGEQLQLPDRDIVVGDVVLFNSHNASTIPADGALLEGQDVKMDESSLTGESEPMQKTLEETPFILSGTVCCGGNGRLLILAVGEHSFSGRIRQAVYADGGQEGDDKTPLFEKLDILALKIGKGGTIAALVCLVAMLIGGMAIEKDPPKDIIQYVITAITVLAVAVPEGLPLAVTLSLAFSSQQMYKQNNLVKNLESCETMGSATTICTDKTGTLTANRMTVRDITVGKVQERMRAGVEVGKLLLQGNLAEREVLDVLCACVSVCTMDESSFEVVAGRQKFRGNPTDCALLVLADDLGRDFRSLRSKTVGRSEATVAQGKPRFFSSSRKLMSWGVPHGSGWRVYVKGAAEIVLSRAEKILSAGNELEEMTTEELAYYEGIVLQYAKGAMRTIALAYKDCDCADDAAHESLLNTDGTPAFLTETGLTLLAVVGIEDPLRPEVAPAIATCYRAGIDVRMVTGDNFDTAVAIAKQANILDERRDFLEGELLPYRAMLGSEFRKRVHKINHEGEKVFDLEAFDAIWPYLRVLARAQPEDKTTLAHGLNRSMLFQDKARCAELALADIHLFPDRQVVAMTGDGTNDAPALKRADVGFAMGISGTQIAKDAADIILLDDNFASIVVAAKWGRNVYDSIAKFLQFQLTVNIVAVLTAIYGSVAYQESPLAAVQMLWVNLIMDSLASLALATEPPDDQLLRRPPVQRQVSIISDQMWLNMLGHAAFQLVWVFAALLYMDWIPTREPGVALIHGNIYYKEHHKASEHYTFLFNMFVQLQLFNEINSRKLYGEFNVFAGVQRNPYFICIWLLTHVIQFVMVQFGGKAIRVKVDGLTLEQWGYCLAIGASSLVWQQLLNLFGSVYSRMGSGRAHLGRGDGSPSRGIAAAVYKTSPSTLSRSTSNVNVNIGTIAKKSMEA